VMRERLAASPLIRDILKGSKKAYKAAADTDLGHKVEDAGERVKERLDDAKEFWETSQNPVVYAMSGIWDNVTGETEEGICLSEILKLDPSFEKEEWANDVKTQLVPDIIKAHLTGDVGFLKQHLGEGVLNKLTQDIKLRESDKIEFDTNILDIDENATIMKFVEENGPVIVCVYMVQQINCIRKAGEIIEGSEEAVVAKFYSVAFTQEYMEDEGEVRWKVVDYEFGGETPYF
jgi:mitochondrial import inner membrane translocase subunit TIM44